MMCWGEAEIAVGGVLHTLTEGETGLLPCGIPHSLKSLTRHKIAGGVSEKKEQQKGIPPTERNAFLRYESL